MSQTRQLETERRLGHIKAAVKAAGVKLTHQRLEIFREVAGSEVHPDVETVFGAVQARVPTVSLDTVYRTLWLLNDLGLATTLGPQREGVRFDANLDPHHHYVCVRCGLVRDFESPALNGLRLPGAVKQLGSVMDARVEVRGVCAKCAREHQPIAKSKKPSDQRRSTP